MIINASNASNENNSSEATNALQRFNETNVYEALLYETVHNYPNKVPFGFKLKYKLIYGVDIKLLDQQEIIFRSLLEQSIRDIHARDSNKVLDAVHASAARPVVDINQRIKGWEVGGPSGR